MNLTLKILITVIVLALNILLYDKHAYNVAHILQLVIEISGLALFSYFIIKCNASSYLKLVICSLLVVILNNISKVVIKYMSDYFPVFDVNYGNYLVIGILLAMALIIFFGIERERNKKPIRDFTLKR